MVRLILAGDLDLATVDVLDRTVEQAITADQLRHLVIDLDGVTFCDSTGVGALIKARDAAAGRGITVRTINPRGSTRRVMQLTDALTVLGGADAG